MCSKRRKQNIQPIKYNYFKQGLLLLLLLMHWPFLEIKKIRTVFVKEPIYYQSIAASLVPRRACFLLVQYLTYYFKGVGGDLIQSVSRLTNYFRSLFVWEWHKVKYYSNISLVSFNLIYLNLFQILLNLQTWFVWFDLTGLKPKSKQQKSKKGCGIENQSDFLSISSGHQSMDLKRPCVSPS